jgi:transcriptional regulator with XRE-family HTH domain
MDRLFFVQWRKKQCLTQAQLALVIGVNPSAVKRWEGGNRPIPNYMGLVMAAIESGLEPVRENRHVEA